MSDSTTTITTKLNRKSISLSFYLSHLELEIFSIKNLVIERTFYSLLCALPNLGSRYQRNRFRDLYVGQKVGTKRLREPMLPIQLFGFQMHLHLRPPWLYKTFFDQSNLALADFDQSYNLLHTTQYENNMAFLRVHFNGLLFPKHEKVNLCSETSGGGI